MGIHGEKLGTTKMIKQILLRINEQLKILICKFNKNRSITDPNKRRVMFVAHTNALIPVDDGFEVDRVESVIREIRESNNLQEYISIVDPLSKNSLLKLLEYENVVHSHVYGKVLKESREVNLPYPSNVYYATYRKIMYTENIRVLCIYAIGTITKSAILAADSLGIPTVYIPHGPNIWESELDLPGSVHYACLSEKHKVKLIEFGVDSRRIHITGPVFLGGIPGCSDKIRIRKRILIATQPYVESGYLTKNEYFGYIRELVDQLDQGIDVTIKLHPRERYRDEYLKMRMGVDINEDEGRDRLYEDIMNSDLVISFGSTVLLEAMAMGVPVINIKLIDFGVFNPLQEDERVIQFSPGDEIEFVVLRIFEDKEFREKVIESGRGMIKDYLYLEGSPEGRVRWVIEGLVRS